MTARVEIHGDHVVASGLDALPAIDKAIVRASVAHDDAGLSVCWGEAPVAGHGMLLAHGHGRAWPARDQGRGAGGVVMIHQTADRVRHCPYCRETPCQCTTEACAGCGDDGIPLPHEHYQGSTPVHMCDGCHAAEEDERAA